MRSSKLFHGILLAALSGIALYIIRYYWTTEELDAIRRLPMELMVLCLGYILIQVLKRWLYRNRNWWDWVYYIGLASAMLPTVLASDESAGLFHTITDYGTVFLLVPVILDVYALLKYKG